MALRKHNAKRDASEPFIVEALQRCGCDVYRLDRPVDLLCYHAPSQALFLIECKTGKAKLNDFQASFVMRWPVHVVTTAEQAVAVVSGFRRKAA